MKKLKRRYKADSMAKKRLSAIADWAVWEKRTKGRTGTRWDSVVGKIWKDLGGNEEEILSIRRIGGYKT